MAGIAWCRRCGRKLTVNYSGKNATVPRYSCRRGALDNGEPRCISFGGLAVDEAVSREVLRVVRPCAVEAAVLAVTEENSRAGVLVDALLLELEADRYAAERAWRQYDAIDPENRLVADELERRWNFALGKVEEAEARVEQAQARTLEQPPEVDGLTGLERQLEHTWNNPATDVRLKKRILRTLIEQIVIDIDDEAAELELVVHWKGGVHSTLRVGRRRRGQSAAHTSPDTVDAIRILAQVCTDEVIASTLNRNGLQTGRGNRWTRERVASLRSHRKFPRYSAERQQEGGWLKLGEAAAYIGVSAKTLRRAVDRGSLEALHPLPDGPWIFDLQELDRVGKPLFSPLADPAGPVSEQLKLVIPNT